MNITVRPRENDSRRAPTTYPQGIFLTNFTI